MLSNQVNEVLVPSEQKFNFRGTWNPMSGDPVLPAKYDAYIVNCNVGRYEVGDWVVRDKANKSFSHIAVGIYSKVFEDVMCAVDKKLSLAVGTQAIENARLRNTMVTLNATFEASANTLAARINELEIRVATLENNIGE